MRQISSTGEMRVVRSKIKDSSLGLVPTMGALHEGHASLVERSVQDNDITIVSIFVNPTQFNDPDDLSKYPRTIDSDLALLSEMLGDEDIVFTPEADDIYGGEEVPHIDLGHLNELMEGEKRPGHFMGVVRIVKILLDLCKPHRAYFGRKDFQQLAVIRSMVRQTGISTDIIACPIVREANGLAMSSRNERLSPGIRRKAGVIYRTLDKYSRPAKPVGIDELKKKVVTEINKTPPFRLEYFEIVDDNELIPLQNVSDIDNEKTYTGCIAVYAGDVRLIDNVPFSFRFSKG